MKIAVIGSLAFVLAACAAHSKPPPPPMTPYLSVAGHEAAAARLEENANAHEGKFNPHARAKNGICANRPVEERDICWTAFVNPTEKHLARAEDDRRLARQHRSAAQSLRDAESYSCAGIPDGDREDSIFDHHADILSVEPLHGGVSRYLNEPWTEGVVVTFRSVVGMSTPWLQHVVDCQIARNAALGNAVPEHPQCLLVPKNIKATVDQVPNGFAVTVRAGTKEAADDILRRGDALNNAVQYDRVRANSPDAPADTAPPAAPAATPAPTPVTPPPSEKAPLDPR